MAIDNDKYEGKLNIGGTDKFDLRSTTYASTGNSIKMTDNELNGGRNNSGELETVLGSLPDADKDNYLYRYFDEHIHNLYALVQDLKSKHSS